MAYQEGDEAGIRSVTIMPEGANAYGYFQRNHVVQHLVPVFTFDANTRRQTSFASVEVMLNLPKNIEVEIGPKDTLLSCYLWVQPFCYQKQPVRLVYTWGIKSVVP